MAAAPPLFLFLVLELARAFQCQFQTNVTPVSLAGALFGVVLSSLEGRRGSGCGCAVQQQPHLFFPVAAVTD